MKIGVDLGGTKILAAVIEPESGKVVHHIKKKTKKDKILSRLEDLIEELLSNFNADSVGIATAGLVDRENGIIINAFNLGAENLNVKSPLEEKFNIPVYLGNDVEASALAEICFGAAKGVKDALCVFVGTGIGSSIIKDGKIHQGFSKSAGEIGHTVIQFNGAACVCGSKGCLEAYASRSAIEKMIFEGIKNGEKTVLTDIMDEGETKISSKYIKNALDAHDRLVTKCVLEAAEYLSCALANVINFYNPELIVLGGGLIDRIDEFYYQTVQKSLEKALPVAAAKTEFKKAFLGDFSATVGATLFC